MYKLLYGLEGAIVSSETSADFEKLDRKADELLMNAGKDLTPENYAGKTFLITLLNRNGGVCYCRAYTVSH